jgi:acyl-CoA thioesterase I
MISLRALTLLLVLGTNGALSAAESPSANSAATDRARIVVLGDSITAGYGIDPTDAYPALLQQKLDAAGLPFTVVNAGVSGDTTSGGLRRINWALNGGADILVVALGGNDGLRGIMPKQTEENLAGIVQRAKAKLPGISVIIAGMQMPQNMGPEYTEEFRALFPRVAKANDAAFVPFLLEGIGGVAEFNQPDLIHPNEEGQRRVADTVWKVLEAIARSRHASAGRPR